jgi:hypothetical protein
MANYTATSPFVCSPPYTGTRFLSLESSPSEPSHWNLE